MHLSIIDELTKVADFENRNYNSVLFYSRSFVVCQVQCS